ncbi:hypothetical protein GQX74_009045 [Glossina fuscipes]|nr:hypothetical protein GQX74_009045 [Glossina fuscipes]
MRDYGHSNNSIVPAKMRKFHKIILDGHRLPVRELDPKSFADTLVFCILVMSRREYDASKIQFPFGNKVTLYRLTRARCNIFAVTFASKLMESCIRSLFRIPVLLKKVLTLHSALNCYVYFAFSLTLEYITVAEFKMQ